MSIDMSIDIRRGSSEAGIQAQQFRSADMYTPGSAQTAQLQTIGIFLAKGIR